MTALALYLSQTQRVELQDLADECWGVSVRGGGWGSQSWSGVRWTDESAL